MYEIYICTVGTWPNFFSHIGSRLACSFSRTSWRAPSCEETKKGRKKKTLNELKCYEGKHSINVQIQQIPLQCYIIIYHIVLYNEQILFKITQIGQIKVNKSFLSSEQKLECKNLKCVDFWMEFGWFFFGHKLDLIATFLIFMQHNTTESQSNMQSMLKRIKSE